jgi:RND family efflux transporter MFP subunit
MNKDTPNPGSPPAGRARPWRRAAVALSVVAIGAVIIIIITARRSTRQGPLPPAERTVAVAPVMRRDLYKELSVEAEFRPYQEVELFSKVAGYLKTITVDFGDRVKEGQLIAVIEVPELQDELNQALAAEQRAEADSHDAHLAYTRLAGVSRAQPNLIAQQDLDSCEARDRALAAAVAGTKADVGKYRTLIAYTRITAPFDGVITARSADPGAMIQAATSNQSQSLPLVQLSENQLLRLDFPVSVTAAADMAVGDPVEIRLDGSNRILRANVSRFTRKVSMATRTMITEVEVPNPDLALIPGMYATVVLKLHRHPGALAVPVEAVNAVGNPTVTVVSPDGTLEERPVKVGLETDSFCEIVRGLRDGERVVVGSRSGLQPGDRVSAKVITPSPTP